MSDELARRIDQLEETLAHHEVMVHDLSDELAKQWQTIERMTLKIRELEEKLSSQAPSMDGSETGDPPPPHY
jgi:uncharacterized coiled-coil protein SlyX